MHLTRFRHGSPSRRAIALWLPAALATGVLTTTVVFSQAPALGQPWWTLNSGGSSSGGGYALRGTLADHDGGWLTGGPYSLAGEPAVEARAHAIYLPRVSHTE